MTRCTISMRGSPFPWNPRDASGQGCAAADFLAIETSSHPGTIIRTSGGTPPESQGSPQMTDEGNALIGDGPCSGAAVAAIVLRP
jgi:hypothetical protein